MKVLNFIFSISSGVLNFGGEARHGLLLLIDSLLGLVDGALNVRSEAGIRIGWFNLSNNLFELILLIKQSLNATVLHLDSHYLDNHDSSCLELFKGNNHTDSRFCMALLYQHFVLYITYIALLYYRFSRHVICRIIQILFDYLCTLMYFICEIMWSNYESNIT